MEAERSVYGAKMGNLWQAAIGRQQQTATGLVRNLLTTKNQFLNTLWIVTVEG